MTDVLITPGSRKIEFFNSGDSIDATISTDVDGNLSIQNPGGDIAIGDVTGDVYVGDGVNSVDLIFEQSGSIFATAGNTLTLGASGASTVITGSSVSLTGTINFDSAHFDDNKKLFFGTSNDLQIYHNGTHSYVQDVGTGHLLLLGNDLRLANSDWSKNYLLASNGGEVKLYYNGVEKLATTSGGVTITGQLTSNVVELSGGVTYDPAGGGPDTATDVGIALTTGTRIIGADNGYIRTLLEWNQSNALEIGQSGTSLINHTKIFGGTNGVELYESTSKKLETSPYGVTVTGKLTTDSAAITGDLVIGGDLTVSGTTTTINTETINLADNVIVLNSNETGTPSQNAGIEVERGTSSNVNFQWNETNDYWEFGQTDVFFEGTSYDARWDTSQNRMWFLDNAMATFGAGGDLQIYHSGSHSYINENGTGNLYVAGNNLSLTSSGVSETYLAAVVNGAVSLYYDNTARMATTSHGISVTGSFNYNNAIDIDVGGVDCNYGNIIAASGSSGSGGAKITGSNPYGSQVNIGMFYSNSTIRDESKTGDPGINFVNNAVVPGGGGLYGPSNNTLDLGVVGQSSYRWKNIRAGTDITTSGGEIGVGTESPAVAIDASSKTDAIGLPKGTTAQRPSSAVTGQFRYNTETPGVEVYDGTSWGAVGGSSGVTAKRAIAYSIVYGRL